MSESNSEAAAAGAGRGRRGRGAGGGADARRAKRRGATAGKNRFFERKIPYFEPLSEEALALIEGNADTVLEEVGIEFRDDAEALELWKAAGADIDGERVRFPRGLCRSLCQTIPRQFTQHARNPERSVEIGGLYTGFAPVYGPPCSREPGSALMHTFGTSHWDNHSA